MWYVYNLYILRHVMMCVVSYIYVNTYIFIYDVDYVSEGTL